MNDEEDRTPVAILLIRHGETTLNAARVVQLPDTPLSERGREQAGALGRRLAGEGVGPIGRIISSDHARAVMTADAIRRATALDVGVDAGVGVDVDSDLAERNFGDLRGTPYAQLDVDLFGPDYHPPGGESWAQFHERVDRAWRKVSELCDATAGHLAVVSHGLVCRSVAERLIEVPAALAPVPSRWANTSLTWIEGPPWRARRVNCTAHLEGDLRDDPDALSGG